MTINVTASVLDEYEPATSTATVVVGQTVTKDFKLVLVTYVTVYVKGPTLFGIPLPLQGATVTLDTQTGTSDGLGMVRFNTTVGSHTLKIKAKDYKDYTKTITVVAGPSSETAALKKTSGSNEETGFLAGIIALGCLILMLPLIILIVIIVVIIMVLRKKKAAKLAAQAPPMQAPPMQSPPPGAPPAPPQS